jgi:hypothetical protein
MPLQRATIYRDVDVGVLGAGRSMTDGDFVTIACRGECLLPVRQPNAETDSNCANNTSTDQTFHDCTPLQTYMNYSPFCHGNNKMS